MVEPAFSIVIPVYPPHYGRIPRLLLMLSRQTYPTKEIIIVASGFNPAIHSQTINGWKRTGAIVKTITSPQRAGANRNTGAEIATGDYVVFVDADDVPHPQKLEATAHLIKTHPDADLILHNFLFKNEAPSLVERYEMSAIDVLHLNSCIKETPLLVIPNPIPVPADGLRIHHGWSTVRRSLLSEFKQHPTMYPGEDCLFCRQIMAAGKQTYLITNPLMVYMH